MLYKI
jgi:hypothetical protein